MERTNIKTETFKLDDGFMVDVVTTDETYEAYLYHKQHGVKDLMFGCPKKQQSYKEFLEIVEVNTDDYIMYYAEDHMDEGFACQLYTADRETGTFIDLVDGVSDGLKLIQKYEENDMEEGIYEPNFYDIVTDSHHSVLL